MSLGYSVDVKLKCEFDDLTTTRILKRGIELGFVYHKFILGESSYDSTPLDIKTAASLIILGDVDGGLHCLNVQFKDTYFLLHFIKHNNDTIIMFSRLSPEWSKEFTGGEKDSDITRYLKTLLDLTQDFKVLSINISKD